VAGNTPKKKHQFEKGEFCSQHCFSWTFIKCGSNLPPSGVFCSQLFQLDFHDWRECTSQVRFLAPCPDSSKVPPKYGCTCLT
jgi:hypothetical protein